MTEHKHQIHLPWISLFSSNGDIFFRINKSKLISVVIGILGIFPLVTYSEVKDDFSGKDWKMSGKTPGRMTIATGNLHLSDNPGNPPQAMVEKSFTVNLDANPIFSVKVKALTQEAQVKLLLQSTKEKTLVFRIKNPGIYNYNIKEKLGWQGQAQVSVYLYACGSEAEINYEYVKFTNKPEDAEVHIRTENLIPDSSFEMQQHYRPVYHQFGEYQFNDKKSGIRSTDKEYSHGNRSLNIPPGETWEFNTVDRYSGKGVFAVNVKGEKNSSAELEIRAVTLDIHGGKLNPESVHRSLSPDNTWKRIILPFGNSRKEWSAFYSIKITNNGKSSLWIDAAQLELDTDKPSVYKPDQCSLRNIDRLANYKLISISDAVNPQGAIDKSGAIKLKLIATKDAANAIQPVSGGIPFPGGELFNGSNISLWDENGHQIPCQSTVLARRNTDGSIVSLLLDFQDGIKSGTIKSYTLKYGLKNKVSMAGKPLVRQEKNLIKIDTGTIGAVINTEHFRGFDEIRRYSDGFCLKAEAGDGSFVVTPDGDTYSSALLRPDECVIERNGSYHAVILVRGKHRNENGTQKLGYEIRIHAFKDKTYFMIEYTIVNQEAPPEFVIRSIGLRLPADHAGEKKAFGLIDAVPLSVSAKTGRSSLTQLRQCDGMTGYELLFTKPDGRRETLPDQIADGMAVNGASSVVVRDFAQLNPKALSLEPGHIGVMFWPDTGVKDLSLPFGFASTLRILYSPMGNEAEEILQLAKSRILLQPDPEWVSESGVFGPFITVEKSRRQFPCFSAIEDNIFNLYQRFHDVTDFNGIFNYGDLGSPAYCANHETEGVDNFWIRYLRDGTPETFRMAEINTLHSRDIDVCHIRKNVAARHTHSTGTHTCFHFHAGHFWQSGILWHYLLTGDQRSFDVAIASAAELVKKSSISYRPGRERCRIIFHLAELYGLTGIVQFRKAFERQYGVGAGSNIGHGYYSGLSLEALAKMFEVTQDNKYAEQLTADSAKCSNSVAKTFAEHGDIHLEEGRGWDFFKAMGKIAGKTGNKADLKVLTEYNLIPQCCNFLSSDYSIASSASYFHALSKFAVKEPENMPEHLFGISRLSGFMPGRKGPNVFNFEIAGDKPFLLRIYKQLRFRYDSKLKYNDDDIPQLLYKLTDPNGAVAERGKLEGTQKECDSRSINIMKPVKGNYQLELSFYNDCWGALSCTAPALLDAGRWFYCRGSLSYPVSFWLKPPDKGNLAVDFRWKFDNNNYAGKILGVALEDRNGKIICRQTWTIPMDCQNDTGRDYCTQRLNLKIPEQLRDKTYRLLINDIKWMEWKIGGLDFPYLASSPDAFADKME